MSKYKVGDKFEIEIGEIYQCDDLFGNNLYRIKGFKSLVFDIDGLNKLKKLDKIEAKPNTVKASELAVDTKVLCWDNPQFKKKKYFAKFEDDLMYTFIGVNSSWTSTDGDMCAWTHMTLEDGTVVLPE